MKVSDCKQCEYYQRKVWTQYYRPLNYHAIGQSHAYGYCKKYGKRCSEVKECKEQEHE